MDSLQQLINALRVLPGVGYKSSEKIAHFLLEQQREGAKRLHLALGDALERLDFCQQCRNLSEQPVCSICSDEQRQNHSLCVVEMPADLNALEQSGWFDGKYFILYGCLSPIDGIGPDKLGIDQLIQLVTQKEIKEVIIATSATVQGDATASYIAQQLAGKTKVSRLAQGVPMGKELHQTDAATLIKAMQSRQPLDTHD
jgi:recombination protein RecR